MAELCFRLGVPDAAEDTWCPKCDAVLDRYSRHAAVCVAGGERTLWHNSVRDIVLSWAARAGLHPEKERPSFCHSPLSAARSVGVGLLSGRLVLRKAQAHGGMCHGMPMCMPARVARLHFPCGALSSRRPQKWGCRVLCTCGPCHSLYFTLLGPNKVISPSSETTTATPVVGGRETGQRRGTPKCMTCTSGLCFGNPPQRPGKNSIFYKQKQS